MSVLTDKLTLYREQFQPVVPFDAGSDTLLSIDFTAHNKELSPAVLDNTYSFCEYVEQKLQVAGARYGFGGYAEHREVYAMSAHFGTPEDGEPRRLHLGIDIWGPAGTPVSAPVGGLVHSFAFNNHHGDYGATIILSHSLDGVAFYTLYGHLSLSDISHLKEGEYVVEGIPFAHFGLPQENGHWPPHLHFQVIEHLGLYRGDYPGVCRVSEAASWLENCPDPDLLLNMRRFAKPA